MRPAAGTAAAEEVGGVAARWGMWFSCWASLAGLVYIAIIIHHSSEQPPVNFSWERRGGKQSRA